VLDRIISSVTGRRRPKGTDYAGGLPFEQLYPRHQPTGLDLPSYRPVATIAASTSSQVLAAANPARKSLVIVNDSASATLYVAFEPAATTVGYVAKVGPGASFVTQDPEPWRGVIAGVWDAAVGSARVTETT
jgi:hypothetical protein